jgi:hypothetical protein
LTATFTGTFGEFYYWFDATIKAWVTVKTKKHRERQTKSGGCNSCKIAAVSLQAHHHPLGRRKLVQRALGVDSDEARLENLDLKDAFDRIESAHKPFPLTLQYLCDSCHKAAHVSHPD